MREVDYGFKQKHVRCAHLRCPLRDGGESSIEDVVDRDGSQGDHSHGWLSSRSEYPCSSIVGSGYRYAGDKTASGRFFQNKRLS